MFTGLVEAVGVIVGRESTPGGVRLRIGSSLAGELSNGDSLAVNGVCLTVTRVDGTEVHADVGPETLRVTTINGLEGGALVNLERPLQAGGRLGGHFVQGHVDGVGQIEAIRDDADFRWFTIGFPFELAPYLVIKGSVAVDGISLTVAALAGNRFDVQIVPYTLEHTNLRRAALHDRVNLECDLVGKYVVRAAELAGITLVRAQGETAHEGS
jgi:riboflavin synthase